MPVENLEEEGLPKNPNLQLAAWRFTLSSPDGKNKENIQRILLKEMKENGIDFSLCLVIVFLVSSSELVRYQDNSPHKQFAPDNSPPTSRQFAPYILHKSNVA